MKKFQTLYKKNSKGKIQEWTIFVEESSSNEWILKTVYGQVGGKLQQTEEIVTSGKNLGKANETTVLEQALSEAESKWTKQIERKGYTLDLNKIDLDERPGAEPMLAHRYDKYGDKIKFSCVIQPKLDGHRCICVIDASGAKLFSRKREQITGLPHIEKAVQELYKNLYKFGNGTKIILDGELYVHALKNEFEKLSSYIRSEEPKKGHEIIQYHIYDTICDESYIERLDTLKFEMNYNKSNILQLVNSQMVHTSEQVIQAFKTHLKQGYEGSILRNLHGKYEGKRSYNLQKVKELDDDEFEIIGVKEGKGRMAGHAIFTCKTKEGHEFDAKMTGSMEKLKEYFENAADYIGKIVTVQFQGYTGKNKVPRFPVALRFGEE